MCARLGLPYVRSDGLMFLERDMLESEGNVTPVIARMLRARALNHRQFAALLEENETEHRDIGYHTAVRWLSLGKVLKSVWDPREEIQDFCVKKGNGIPQLSDADWITDLGFAVDVTALMNELNVKLQ
ncbi:hypothetical protein chiPu_0019534 [Chiloscyllium punctatum]|uniref:Uncharacterized protein n=1 Tax=Chiloscyllium punctatum TaxID=137246 RepID=A0A401RSF4_CHIPU|nr:hypothetical protein [Chiloscyllium punctatum]